MATYQGSLHLQTQSKKQKIEHGSIKCIWSYQYYDQDTNPWIISTSVHHSIKKDFENIKVLCTCIQYRRLTVDFSWTISSWDSWHFPYVIPNMTRGFKLPPRLQNIPMQFHNIQEQNFGTFKRITFEEFIKHNLKWQKMALAWPQPQYDTNHIILHYFSVVLATLFSENMNHLRNLKAKIYINGQNIALIWAKYGPNILSIVIHHLCWPVWNDGFFQMKTALTWASIPLFAMHDSSVEIQTLSGIWKQIYYKNNQHRAPIWSQ